MARMRSALLLALALGAASADDGDAEEFVYVIPDGAGMFFYESFQGSSLEDIPRWENSGDAKFTGEWKVGKGLQHLAEQEEQGLIVKSPAQHHAISTKFPSPFVFSSEEEFVVQYEVRFHKHHECGGAYIKLLQDTTSFSPSTFTNEDGYVVMFGPDKCGETNKVHLIIRHQNPITKEYEEKHLNSPPQIRNDRLTHVYTVVLRKDNTYELFIDQISVKSGSMFSDFTPAFTPPTTIADPDDHKPSDWVDEARINDPSVSKPADWDEDAPRLIPDPTAEKPAGWGDEEPEEIPDPEAEKPDDWDDEDDGEWEAPMVPNPVCQIGCGPWSPPMVPNPAYKGPWQHPQIDNPEYVGKWSPKQIPNPAYFEETSPFLHLGPIGGVGIEIWTMQDEIEFDNLVVDNSFASANALASQTWKMKGKSERVEEDKGDWGPLEPVAQFLSDNYQQNPTAVIIASIVVGACMVGLLYVQLCGEDSPAPEEDDDQGDDGSVTRTVNEVVEEAEASAGANAAEGEEEVGPETQQTAPKSDNNKPKRRTRKAQ